MVLRLALYLRSVGIEPFAAGVQMQYDRLESEERKRARSGGRRLLKECGSIAKATESLITGICQQMLSAEPARHAAQRIRTRKEQFPYKSRRWSPLTPPCAVCRMGCGWPKRSWPSREKALEVRDRQHDRGRLVVFACPVQPGFWHLAHSGRRVPFRVTPQAYSVPPSELPTLQSEVGGCA